VTHRKTFPWPTVYALQPVKNPDRHLSSATAAIPSNQK
jgi:hypothetical protein